MAQPKQRNQLVLLAALLAIAGLVWYFYFGGNSRANRDVSSVARSYTPINAQDFGKTLEKLKITETTEYKTKGRNIFVASAEPVPEAQKPAPAFANSGPQPPPPPPPTQLPMKFFGYGTVPTSGSRRAFLLDGEDVYIVSEGEVVLNHIRITHIGNERIDFIDTNTGQSGSNTIEAAPSPS